MSEMLELGALLREERERKGLSIDELSEHIKLAPRTLAFIESGTKSELPHAVYVKGFVKSYAVVVGLDPEELGAMVDLAYKGELEEEMAEPITTERKKSNFPLRVVVVVLLVGSLAAAGYFYTTMNPSSNANVAEVAPKVVADKPEQVVESSSSEMQQEIEAVQQDSVQSESVAEDAAIEPEKIAAEDVDPVEEKPVTVDPVAQAVPVVAPMDVAEQEATEASAAAEEVVAVERKLLIKAAADCWVEAKGDGYGRKEFLLRSGESYTVTFPKELSVRLGNSGGISLTLDGKPYVFDGKDGRVRTVHIAAS